MKIIKAFILAGILFVSSNVIVQARLIERGPPMNFVTFKHPLDMPSSKKFSIQPRHYDSSQFDYYDSSQFDYYYYSENEIKILGCGQWTLSPGETVLIESPGYPGKYPKNYKCNWYFDTNDEQSLLSIECQKGKWQPCRKSLLKIDVDNIKAKKCNKPETFSYGDTSFVKVYFRTSWAKPKYGFQCEISASSIPTTTTTTSTTTEQPSTNSSSSSTVSPDETCKKCGTVNRSVGGKIVGGEFTEKNEYPWQVALVNSGTNFVFCGGSLYNDKYVITAAHCGEVAEGDDVILGAHNVNSLSTDPTVQRIPIKKIINHENYNSNLLANDIAVLELASAAILNDQVKPACLPDPNNNYDGTIATVSGWGTTSYGGSQPNTLMDVKVPIVTNNQCEEAYGNLITGTNICAGTPQGGKDACQGDSGGPLVVKENGHWVLVGIVSWGNDCGHPEFPGVYTRVTEYLNWMEDNTKDGANKLCSGEITQPSIIETPQINDNGCKCGQVNQQNKNIRIIGGEETHIHEYPWQVAFIDSSGVPTCSGSIITDSWILTTAKCVYEKDETSITVVVGEHDWDTADETSETKILDIEKIIVHESYSTITLVNDIALVKTLSPLTFEVDNKIAPVCLPPSENSFNNVDAIVAGWGTLSYDSDDKPNELHDTTVETMSNSDCGKVYGLWITDGMICAGTEDGGKDTCKGDSGAPLITDDENSSKIQIGIASFGYKCGLPNIPGVYTRVTSHLEWIYDKISNSTTCPSS